MRRCRCAALAGLVLPALGGLFALDASAQSLKQSRLPTGYVRESRAERVRLTKDELNRLITAGKSPSVDPATGELVREKLRDRLPAGWLLEPPKGAAHSRTDSLGNPIVNDTPGLPAWAQRDVDALRASIVQWRDQVVRSHAAGNAAEAEGVLGNLVGQAITRGIPIDDIVDIDASPVMNERVAGAVLDYLHFYENVRFTHRDMYSYVYEPTRYPDRVRAFVERHAGSLEALQAIEQPGGMQGRDGAPSGCYTTESFARGMTVLTGQTDIWMTNGADDAAADVPTGFPMFFFYDCHDHDFNDQVRVSTNGYISFFQQGGGAEYGTTYTNDPIALSDDPDGYIAPWWDDLVVAENQGNTDRVSYKTEGALDQRVFTVEWFSMTRLGGDTTDFHFFQIKLYETLDIIELHLSNDWHADSIDSATCGMESYDGTAGDCGPNCLNTNSELPPSNYRFTPAFRPSNDSCDHAVALVNGSVTEGNLRRATSGNIPSCSQGTNRDVWYTYTATCNGTVSVTTCGSRDLGGDNLGVDTVLSVYSNCPATQADQIACNDDAGGTGCSGTDSAVAFPVAVGQQFWIRVSHFGDLPFRFGNGRFLINLELTGATPPGNNDCANATPIANRATLVGNLLCANNDGVAGCGGSENNADVWYRFVAPTGGRLTISTCGTRNNAGADTGPDTVVSIHGACPGTYANELACNDDSFVAGCNGVDSRAAAILTAGQGVRIRVSHYGGTPFRVGNGLVVVHADFDCVADFNANGVVNSQDFFDFLSAFFAALPSADVNLDNRINSQDFFDFLTAFFSGC